MDHPSGIYILPNNQYNKVWIQRVISTLFFQQIVSANALALNPTILMQQPQQYVALPPNQVVQNVNLLNSVQNGLGISGIAPPKQFVVGGVQPHSYQIQQQPHTQNFNTCIGNLVNTVTSSTTAHLDNSGYLELAHREYQAGNYASAEKYCQTVLASEPGNVNALLLLSSIYFQLKDLDK